MAKQRIQISEDVAALLLYRSNRCCCVCRKPRKAVQIHHIDENPANNDADNLAVLCLECHNDTQVRGGFGRRLDAVQVRQFKSEWQRTVEAERALLPLPNDNAHPDVVPGDEARREHDRNLFREAQAIMSEDDLNRFIEPLWNGDEYYSSHYDPVRKYARFWQAADHELLNDELRQRCDAMRLAFEELFEFLSYNFFRSVPAGPDGTQRYVMHPRLCLDRGGSGGPEDAEKYDAYQEKLGGIIDGAYTSWREFRRAVKQVLVL